MKDFRITYSSPKYYIIYKNTRTITCEINVHIHVSLPMESFNDYFTVEGTSVCRKDDIWDEKLGKKIAKLKAKRKAQLKAYKIILRKENDALLRYKILRGALKKIKAIIDSDNEYLKKLSGIGKDRDTAKDS